MALHALAEMLHKCVYELEDMPASEYRDWIYYFDEKARRKEVKDGNLMAMTPEEAISRFTL